MPFTSQGNKSFDQTDKFIVKTNDESDDKGSSSDQTDPLARMEKSVTAIFKARPHLSTDKKSNGEIPHYQALLDISAAINSTLVTDEILQIVMRWAIELLKAERGFLMLLDENNQLQVRTVHNLRQEDVMREKFRYSRSIADEVAATGESVYTSDAQQDARYSGQKSITELNLRSIMCVPLKIKDKVIGVIYLDNSTEARLFLESDLYLFELFATQAAIAINNSRLYEEILRLKRYNEGIVSNTPVGLVVLNAGLEIVSMNSSAEQIFDKTYASPMKLNSLLSGNMLARWTQSCRNVLANKVDESFPRSYVTVNEAEKVLSVKISPFELVDDSGMGLIVVIEDITEKVILENYVTISEKLIAKGEMAASVGHELNNFLAIISNNAELAQIRLKRGEYDKLEKSCGAIVENIDKIKRFTDNLMDLSNLDQDGVTYNINHLVDDLLFSIKSQERFESVTFVVRNSPDLPDCTIDVGQIQQVFLNLLYNAADAMRESDRKSEIIITTFVDKDLVTTTVRDSGCGITPQNMKKVFDPHFSTKPEGHGLGLANCKRIIENHGGTITVRSEVGEYTEFRVSLPRKG
jgi:nitrogen-specific signal transduction histidine kinase